MPMLIDPFALLGLPRRPMIDQDLLKKNLRSLVLQCHPDHRTGDTKMFEEIQEASNLLRSTPARLRNLAGEIRITTSIPMAAQELFESTNKALENAANLTSKYHDSTLALLKALLLKELLLARRKLINVQESLHYWHRSLEEELNAIDLRWPNVRSEELMLLAQSFLFAQRWDDQLREAVLQINLISPKNST